MRKPERRRDPRAFVNTCVTLSCGLDEQGVYRLIDLSAGGVRLSGHCPVPIGYEVTARLHFSPFEVTVSAVALREDAHAGGSTSFALRFDELAPEVRACVQKLVEMTAHWAPAEDLYDGSSWAERGVLS
jgi:hypothetical protein